MRNCRQPQPRILEIPLMNDDAPLGSIHTPGIPQFLEKVGHFHKIKGYLVPEDKDWQDTLSPHFWVGVLRELEAGDRIEVHSADHQVQFLIFILNCNSVVMPPTL